MILQDQQNYMKYKKQIATGAIALSFLVGGSFVFAETPRDLGIKNIQINYQRQTTKDTKKTRGNKTIGTILSLNDSGFIIETKNIKTQKISSLDIKTDDSTLYSKNGAKTTIFDLQIGQKVIINGSIDKIANTVLAQKVKIVTKIK